MKTGLYKDIGGGEQNVIEVDPISEMVLVDYGNGRTVWYAKEDYSTWTYADVEEVAEVSREISEPQTEPTAEQPEPKPKRKSSPAKKTATKKETKPKPKKK